MLPLKNIIHEYEIIYDVCVGTVYAVRLNALSASHLPGCMPTSGAGK